jgi:Homing endonuclease associated repeat
MRSQTTRLRLSVDEAEVAQFASDLRRRYSDEDILTELRECAGRIGRSPTMREFVRDRRTRVHPQTVIEHFGTWNAAKRLAGLVPRRFATREELLGRLRALGDELGRVPTTRDLREHRATMPSKSLYWHTFGSLSNALREAGFDVPLGEERLERAVDQGVRVARRLRRLPRFVDWSKASRRDDRLLTEWQIYRLFGARRGAWARFQFAVRSRLLSDGNEVGADGRLKSYRTAAVAASAASRARQKRRSSGARTAGKSSSVKVRSGSKASRRATRPSTSVSKQPSGTSRARSRTPA